MATLNELEIYNLAITLSDSIYELVSEWKYFDKDTLGKQIVRSADSVALNIAEGYGRFHFKESKRFCYFARGSLTETYAALKMSKNRKLISTEKYVEINTEVENLLHKLNAYIKFLRSRE